MKILLVSVLLFIVDSISCQASSCPIEEDPTNLARCIQIDITAIIYAVRGAEDLTTFCQLADRYMECLKTYTRGCVGFHFAEGSLTELQSIALYCCKGIYSSPDCPLNMSNRKCFDSNSTVLLANGTRKLMKNVQVGDRVKTFDSNGHLINTSIIMIMDKSESSDLFMNIQTYSNRSLIVSANHLVGIPNQKFKFAKKFFQNDTLLTYDREMQRLVEDTVKLVTIIPVQGYSAPLTQEGTLLVNDVLASCYATIDSHRIAHGVMAPVRLWSSLKNGFYTQENTQNGTHWYPQMLYSFTNLFLNNLIKLH